MLSAIPASDPQVSAATPVPIASRLGHGVRLAGQHDPGVERQHEREEHAQGGHVVLARGAPSSQAQPPAIRDVGRASHRRAPIASCRRDR
jgi:hypothetical protein